MNKVFNSGFIMENNAAIYWKVGQPTTQYTLRIIRY